MKNFTQKTILTLALTSKKILPVKNSQCTPLIYSLYATTSEYNINLAAFQKRLELLQCEKIFIYNILPFGSQSAHIISDYNKDLPISVENPLYYINNITLKNFLIKNILKDAIVPKTSIADHPLLSYSVFIFNSLPFPFITTLMRQYGFWFTPGATSKRGCLSPTEYRLSQFITCCEGMRRNTIFDSYHNYNKFGVQAIVDQTKFELDINVKDILKLYDCLEEFLKTKLNYKISEAQPWDLRMDGNYPFNYRDFYDYYIDNVVKKESNSNSNSIIKEN